MLFFCLKLCYDFLKRTHHYVTLTVFAYPNTLYICARFLQISSCGAC
jgi:hypothetical protein